MAAGHDVTAYARTPGKLPTHPEVHAIAGTLDDIATIGEAVQGSDAVLSLLGPSTKRADSLQLVSGYRHIIDAMRTHHVDRLVGMGTASITDPTDGTNVKIAAMITAVKLIQKPAYDAIRGIGELVRESGLDWTIVRLPFLTDGPQTATVNAGPWDNATPCACPERTPPPTSSPKPATTANDTKPPSSPTNDVPVDSTDGITKAFRPKEN